MRILAGIEFAVGCDEVYPRSKNLLEEPKVGFAPALDRYPIN